MEDEQPSLDEELPQLNLPPDGEELNLLPDEDRNRAKISTPKPIKNLYKLFEKCTPEEKYYSAIRLLQGWNDPTIKPTVKLNSMTSVEDNETEEDPIDILERNDILLFTQHCEQVIKEALKDS